MSIVAVLGASDKPERYSNMAVEQLVEHGEEVIPINTAGKTIHSLESVKSITVIDQAVDTLTMYVSPAISQKLEADILAADIKRVIFNPGTENSDLQAKLADKGVEVVEGCTLVMLRTGQF